MALTLFGNALITLGATSFYLLERNSNPNIHGLLDAFWWSVSTVTTVGGDISPVTTAGKVIGLAMMILGTATFWSYTALFAETVLMSDVSDIETEMMRIEKIIKLLNEDENVTKQQLSRLMKEVSNHLKTIKAR